MIRSFVGFAAVGLTLLLAGCGGDDEAGTQPPSRTEATTEAQQPTTEGRPPTADRRPPATQSPEQQPGGAGDEEPIHSNAVFTAQGGAIRPRTVSVPPFIAIRVELRSRDGRRYALRFGRRTLSVGPDRRGDAAEFAGLRPEGTLVGTPVGAGNLVRVIANAEPGP